MQDFLQGCNPLQIRGYQFFRVQQNKHLAKSIVVQNPVFQLYKSGRPFMFSDTEFLKCLPSLPLHKLKPQRNYQIIYQRMPLVSLRAWVCNDRQTIK